MGICQFIHIIHNGVVIIQCDVLENSFVAAYDSRPEKRSGKPSAMNTRDGVRRIFISIQGKTYVVVKWI